MRLKTVGFDLSLLILVMPTVLLIFKWISDRRIASVFAGSLFVGVPLILMVRRARHPFRTTRSMAFWWVGVLGFWLFFAVPILGMRLASWETPFQNLSFIGVPANQMHAWSNIAYILMMSAVFCAGWFSAQKK